MTSASVIEIVKELASNPIFAGLSGATLLAGVVYWLRKVPAFLYWVFRYNFTVSFTVKQGDMAFDWLDRWLAKHPSSFKTNSLKLVSEGYEEMTNWMLTAGYGTRLIWINRHPFLLNRGLVQPPAGAMNTQSVEEITIETIARNQKPIRDLISMAHAEELNKVRLSVRVWSSYWSIISGKEARSLDSIVLKQGQMQRILDDITWFNGARDWYFQRGIPYRRGYIFSGQPGTGKTSLVIAIAAHFKRPLCMLNLGSLGSDKELFSALLNAPINAIILIEDIDCASASTQRKPPKKQTSENEPVSVNDDGGGITKSGLLNALDGVLTPDGRIVIMTTNQPESLDDALVRPGRADVHEVFEYLGPQEQIELAAKFYDEPFMPINTPQSPARMQAAFMKQPLSAIAGRQELLTAVMDYQEKEAA